MSETTSIFSTLKHYLAEIWTRQKAESSISKFTCISVRK